MLKAVGIDTGGTYTDGVLINIETQEVLKKAKARTTKENLTIGIQECLDKLNLQASDNIAMVALSTTLATNAIVEEKGGDVGAVLIGHEPIKRLPTTNYCVVAGGHDLNGISQQELDEEEVIKGLQNFKNKVDSIAISGYFSIRNPIHEIRVKEMVKELLGIPVVCAHELTTALGFQERTTTAILNARLLPIIEELIKSVKGVLKKNKIGAPLMIVKSDGSLAVEKIAMERPIETILSGPAASIIGSSQLAKRKNAIILDMGGTTTDIAVIKNGEPKLNMEGASVGGWLTRVKAAEIYTYGIGGDSLIQVMPKQKEVLIGPKRVYPICYIAQKHPHLIKELKQCKAMYHNFFPNQATDCFLFLKDLNSNKNNITDIEQQLLTLVKKEPHSIYYLARELAMEPSNLPYRRLADLGVIGHISVTPTDILHAAGELDVWNKEAASAAVNLLAKQINVNEERFIEIATEGIVNKLIISLLQALIYSEGKDNRIIDIANSDIFVNKILKKDKTNIFKCCLEIPDSLVAIGAPVNSWLPKVSGKIKANLVIPSHFEVANAVGAAVGKIIEKVEVLIRPNRNERGFSLHFPWEYLSFIDYEEAVEHGIKYATKYINEKSNRIGCELHISVDRYDSYTKVIKEDDLFLETRITITGVGSPIWRNS